MYVTDVFCLNETKIDASLVSQFEKLLAGYSAYWNCALKKGYSGTAVFVKTALRVHSVSYGFGAPEHDDEGRVITLEFDKFYFVGT